MEKEVVEKKYNNSGEGGGVGKECKSQSTVVLEHLIIQAEVRSSRDHSKDKKIWLTNGQNQFTYTELKKISYMKFFCHICPICPIWPISIGVPKCYQQTNRQKNRESENWGPSNQWFPWIVDWELSNNIFKTYIC